MLLDDMQCSGMTAIAQALLVALYVTVEKAEESVEHFLLHCENYAKRREVMINNVQDVVLATKSRQRLKS